MATKGTKSHEALILSRVVASNRKSMTPEIANAILMLGFDKADHDRMHELAQKSQSGTLKPSEEEEMASYRRIGYFLDLLRSKARKALAHRPNS